MNRAVPNATSVALLAATTLMLVGCGPLGGAPEEEKDVFTIAVGDCLNDVTDDEISSLPVVDCDEPHDQEVFASTTLSGESYPGDQAVTDELDSYCAGNAFAEFVGLSYADSHYEISGLRPTAASWDNGDRELLCTIRDPDGQTTGTLAGINR